MTSANVNSKILETDLANKVATYLRELEKCTPETICPLFSENADIHSPFLGWMKPKPFFEKLKEASGASAITPIDICVSSMGNRRVTGYFRYDWTLKDGSTAPFDCVDVFEFSDDGLIDKMVIVYDTHPIRETVGDKYSHD